MTRHFYFCAMTPIHVLKKYFGYDSFRPLQEEIIQSVLNGQDTLVLMPTGGGKSICFQVPALLLDGLTVVISPLIALMKDQVEALRSNGISAAFLNSSQSVKEQDAVLWQAKVGDIKLLYISPERIFSGHTIPFLQSIGVSLFAIDESHCISSWGHDFRPEYRQLRNLRSYFKSTPVIALTATADRVTRADICLQLGIAEENSFISSFDRPNLSLQVLPGRQKMQQMKDFLLQRPNQAGIIYCLSRKATEKVASDLQLAGYQAECYHAGLSNEERSRVQEAFLKDDIQVVVATIAFGMGIDKSNVRWVIHYNLPANVESFYQEIGRAGRDGERADTVLFYSISDIISRKEMILQSSLPEPQKILQEAKLERMQQYAQSDICRRIILLSYFNESTVENCGNCDVCRNPPVRFDGTDLAQKALSAIARTNQQIAMGLLIDILRGSRNQQVLRSGYEKIKTFGAGKDIRTEEWVDYISQMLNTGLVDIAYDQGHRFVLNEASWEILRGNRKVALSRYVSAVEHKEREEEFVPSAKSKQEELRQKLFEHLRLLRKQVADSLKMPPYLIFSDSSLIEMATKRPVTKSQMMDIGGVGEEKYKRFGELFLHEVRNFVEGQSATGMRVTAKGMTYVQTFELYKKGYSVAEIAKQRELNQATVVQHLIRMKPEEPSIDLWKLIEKEDYVVISKKAQEIGITPLLPMKPLFEALNGEFGYDKIRLAMAIWEDEIRQSSL